jgi:V/A-type H+-transporting ATPase subunit I
MIVRMKRLTLLCLTGDRDKALDELRALGVVHVADRRPPAGEELEGLRAHLAATEQVQEVLSHALDATERAAAAPQSGAPDAAETVAEVLDLLERRDALDEDAVELRRELERYASFGEFDLEGVHGIRSSGVWTALVVAPPDEILTPAEGVVLTELRKDKHGRYALLATLGGHDEPALDLGGHYELVPWPRRPLAEVREELASVEPAQAAIERRLAELAVGLDAVAEHARATADETRYAEVRAGMDQTDDLSVLSGYVPSAEQDAVRSAATAHGWGILLEEPQPGEDVPVQLRQSRWVRPVRTVFDFLHIYPGYWEVDAGWVVLPFFTLFFAMIVGDAGYALLLLALTAVLQWRLKKVPAYVFHMMYVAGAATLVWGVLNGSYFGIPNLPPFLESLTVPWIQDRDNLIDFCFLIGAIQLSIAHVWNTTSMVLRREWYKVPSQVGWLLVVWSMFFLARQTVLGRGMPDFLLVLLAVGIVLIALFMKTPREFKESWIDHALLPLTLVGNFVDILSYIRLFAVGYASVAVLAAFNGMAADIGFSSPLTAIAASLLLLFANALNIVLAGLGVLVHAVRLNTLEFSTHKGLAWEGHTLYTPFASGDHAAH